MKLFQPNSYLGLQVVFILTPQAGIACWLERRTRDRKVASSNSGRSGGGILFSRVNSVCGDSYSVSVPPQCYCSGTKKTPVVLPKLLVAGYT